MKMKTTKTQKLMKINSQKGKQKTKKDRILPNDSELGLESQMKKKKKKMKDEEETEQNRGERK